MSIILELVLEIPKDKPGEEDVSLSDTEAESSESADEESYLLLPETASKEKLLWRSSCTTKDKSSSNVSSCSGRARGDRRKRVRLFRGEFDATTEGGSLDSDVSILRFVNLLKKFRDD
jgi:hypothetical protein